MSGAPPRSLWGDEIEYNLEDIGGDNGTALVCIYISLVENSISN